MTEYALEVEGLSKTFGGKPAVQDVSFQARKGELTGFLGPNGAGKTTTLRMSLGVIVPDSGAVKLFGQAPNTKSMDRVGFLPEERGVYRKMTAEAVIVFFARLKGLSAGEARRRALVYLERFGLKEAATKKIKELSKGMAQKIQIISAIIHEPDFIILDEPFSGLDPVNQAMLEQVIREQAQAGRTVLFSTHVMEHAERLCDRIVLMARGRKVFDGRVDEALARVPRQVTLGASAGSNLAEVVSPMGEIETLAPDEDGSANLLLTLKPGVDAQDVLRACVQAGVPLTRFEPRRPHLHDAFVALVGEDAVETLRQEA
ncbi:MAG: ABC transporter ATP-binding protein [Oceanicaulis sp.]|jgi:ABC-2 type transport system ATP-binding protein|uniref:ABC transporter ATP-binding protein n=1 Tax=unclassified Oceanicaulis TaxID=2632123 RepID=UPI000066A277|nr:MULTISPECIES: ATP-binding cassette domain-containing protein [unclassified Oceanicaulis]EAP90138.1 ABC transporter, ATP-binding protein [Oceanicaulis sp. HTCC2633]MAB70869.1 ABC transporter ATP-binding protein [Oceanicaulis sp.]MBC39113.1 ABC transporter ATP-binding protein [Oceanicaulis sp.]MBG35247.1 ABC transporter ATP-binding protein [Oceanicaulis sp.]HBU62054.1 ABC transporter ATP-binding protein [Oceanicaulis sp.]|tara:strand:- start:130 stop:1077 length:948 start_codon:yes stop_codon:yes gene_type:complete